MIKQVLLPILGTVAFIIAVGLFVQKSKPATTPTSSPIVTIGEKTIKVTVAKTKEERSKGLSGTTSLEENNGMLFVFDPEASPTFWMKDMLISIDIIWISDGKVVKIDKNVQIDSKTYNPGQPIDYVLEVNAGFSDKNNIKVGDPATITL